MSQIQFFFFFFLAVRMGNKLEVNLERNCLVKSGIDGRNLAQNALQLQTFGKHL